MASKKEFIIAPLGEGALILALGAIGFAARQPLIFTSLGPTAYELVEKPEANSAKAYNIIAGHLAALGAGFLALWLVHGWNSPKVASEGVVTSTRLWAAVIAVTITTLATLALSASQPASLSTTLLVSLGTMQTARDAVVIIVGVLIITAIGEPLKQHRLKSRSAVRKE